MTLQADIHCLTPSLFTLTNLQKMAGFSLALVLLLDFSLLSRAQSGPPLQVLAANRVYGPDGPWQAVTVQLGTPA